MPISMRLTPFRLLLSIALSTMLLNAFLLSSPLLGFFTLLALLLSSGAFLGPLLFPNHGRPAQMAIGVMGIIAVFAVLGSAYYYAAPVSAFGLTVLVLMTLLFVGLLGRHASSAEGMPSLTGLPFVFWTSSALALLSLAAWWHALSQVETLEAVRSPWFLLSPHALLALIPAFILLFSLYTYTRGKTLTFLLTGATLFSLLSVAAMLFPLGYGFDPFIHRATVAHILEFGTITPKPLYYIGQYALELIAVHVFHLPLSLVDRFFVPIVASFFLTASAGIGFSTALKQKHLFPLAILFLAPLGGFIITTPQALAYAFILALLFLSLPVLLDQENKAPWWTLLLFAAAALITHPLAGIPAVLYLVLLYAATWKGPHPIVNGVLVGLTAALSAVSLPLVFILQAKQADLSLTFSLSRLFDFERLPLTFFLDNRFASVPDFLYLFLDNHLLILAFLAALGAVFAHRHGVTPAIHLPLLAAVVWFINFWILSTTLEFSFLIEYERQNYAARLLTLTQFFLLPSAGFALAGIYEYLKHRSRGLLFGVIVLLALFAAANVYGTYPRHDNYARSSGFNVAQSDIDAVWAIEEAGAGEDFVVLANQAVSAAALQEFGFKTYYEGDIFYYPIPTGGPLYSLYLEMAHDEPSRLRALEAMDLAGVDRAFFVLNAYWWRSEVISEHAKNQADTWFSVGNGDVMIFIYER